MSDEADLPQMPAPSTPNSLQKEAEFLGQSGLQVTGKSRMEAAYGSGDGDGDSAAIVAKTGTIDSGTIFHQVYRPWRGKLNSRWVRNWTILRHHIYGIFTKGHRPWPTYTKLVIVAVVMGSLIPIFTTFLGVMSGSDDLMRIFGITRATLWGHVLGTFHNICCWPLVTALIVGGLISEDRQHGTSAIYFSRPVTRTDYTLMKYISAALVLSMIIVFSYCAYYAAAIILNNEGWGYLLDTFPYFFGGLVAALMLVLTYTSIGLALSSISKGKFFPAVAFIGIVFGTKILAFFINLLFERDTLYLLSPHDNLAHVGQWMMELNTTYKFPVAWSFVALLVMNVISLYILISRVNSLEVTRE
ncbi:MAG: ABC transporter permease [Candidatus Thalassarchaeaceae archaeon]|jgi:ABC-type transport system involved in multi-copper enzyme maturation permease subunit|nr:ABC transporter permease [Candidatus Thalassarchaeaceae archaeon]